MTSIERTAYPRSKRLINAHELHLFFSPTHDELEWAGEATDGAEHLLALLLRLKSYQRMGGFPALEDVPEQVVEFVRRAVELPEGTLPVYRAERTAKHHRGLVRKRVGVAYDQAAARRIAEQAIRKEAAAKNRPADLINVALEKVVEAGLELPGFSTLDKMASKIRAEVNASICLGIHDRIRPLQQAEVLWLGLLLDVADRDGTDRGDEAHVLVPQVRLAAELLHRVGEDFVGVQGAARRAVQFREAAGRDGLLGLGCPAVQVDGGHVVALSLGVEGGAGVDLFDPQRDLAGLHLRQADPVAATVGHGDLQRRHRPAADLGQSVQELRALRGDPDLASVLVVVPP
ncbi:DUF4158 domain-containing protein [Streptomyces puniciscabiei]